MVCPHCNDAGWVTRAARSGERDLCFTAEAGFKSVLVRCASCRDDARRQAELVALCGLSQTERGYTLAQYRTNSESRQDALTAANAVLTDGGWLTLSGKYGTGKTYLLCALVNAAVGQGRKAIYITTSRLLDYLRSAYKPGFEIESDRFWDSLVRADLLAMDETEKYSPTPWAEERFNMLIDLRYRQGQGFASATVFATNDADQLPGYLKSRALDRRFKFVKLIGRDERWK